MILIVLDAGKPLTHKKIIEQELFSFGIRINQKPPNVKIVKKENGGIGYQAMVPQTKGMNVGKNLSFHFSFLPLFVSYFGSHNY